MANIRANYYIYRNLFIFDTNIYISNNLYYLKKQLLRNIKNKIFRLFNSSIIIL